MRALFQPTLPARGATEANDIFRGALGISTHAPREGSDQPMTAMVAHEVISTRAPREGSDTVQFSHFSSYTYFNPRSPRGERPLRPSPAVPV